MKIDPRGPRQQSGERRVTFQGALAGYPTLSLVIRKRAGSMPYAFVPSDVSFFIFPGKFKLSSSHAHSVVSAPTRQHREHTFGWSQGFGWWSLRASLGTGHGWEKFSFISKFFFFCLDSEKNKNVKVPFSFFLTRKKIKN